jgi:hypothetical protein
VKENWVRSFDSVEGQGVVEEWLALKPDRVATQETRKTISLV